MMTEHDSQVQHSNIEFHTVRSFVGYVWVEAGFPQCKRLVMIPLHLKGSMARSHKNFAVRVMMVGCCSHHSHSGPRESICLSGNQLDAPVGMNWYKVWIRPSFVLVSHEHISKCDCFWDEGGPEQRG